MRGNGRVAVIVPTKNRAMLLKRSLAALQAQTYPIDELIVVDDGSSDETADVVQRFSGVRYLRLSSPSGKATAVNHALTFVESEFVWIFDDDDMAVIDAVERFRDTLRADPHAGFAYGRAAFVKGLDNAEHGEILHVERAPDIDERGLVARLMRECFLGGARVFYRAEAIRAVGCFDTSLLRSQDYGLCLDVALRFPVREVRNPSAPVYLHRVHAGDRWVGTRAIASDEVYAQWQRFDRMIFRRLWSALPIDRYLAAERRWPARTLHLQRAVMMSRREPHDEAASDLAAITDLTDGGPLSPLERALSHELLLTETSCMPWVLRDDAAALRQLTSSSATSANSRWLWAFVVSRIAVRTARSMLRPGRGAATHTEANRRMLRLLVGDRLMWSPAHARSLMSTLRATPPAHRPDGGLSSRKLSMPAPL